MPDTDYTPLNHKIETALATYLASIRASMALDGLQVIDSHQDAAALDSPRVVVRCDSLDPRSPDLPGIFDAMLMVDYISQPPDVPAATHKTTAGTLAGWLHDVATVKAALTATDGLHCYFYEPTGSSFSADEEGGTQTTSLGFKIVCQGKSAA